MHLHKYKGSSKSEQTHLIHRGSLMWEKLSGSNAWQQTKLSTARRLLVSVVTCVKSTAIIL